MKMLFNNKLFKRIQSGLLAMCMLVSILSAGIIASAAAMPQIESIEMNETRNMVTIKFSTSLTEVAGVNMKSKIKLCRDGGSELSLPNYATVTVREDSLVINLPEPLAGKENYFIILADAFKDQPRQIKTDYIDASDPDLAPDSISIDETKKIVTIKFATDFTGYPSDDSIKNGYISLARDGSNFDEIIKGDQIAVKGSSAKIVITLDKALTGAVARFKIAANKIKSKVTGNINLSAIVTPIVNALDTEAPKLKNVDVNNGGSRVVFTFDRNIRRTSGITPSILKSNITISRNDGYYAALSNYDEVEISEKTLIVKLYYPFTGNNNYVRINTGVIADVTSGDPITQAVYSPALNLGEEQTEDSAPKYKGIIYDRSNNMLRIFFDEKIRAVSTQKLLAGIDISADGGWTSFTSFKNIEIFNNNSILITLRTAIGANTRFRVDGNTVQDYDGNIQKNNQYTDYIDEKGNGTYTDELPEESDKEPEEEDEEETKKPEQDNSESSQENVKVPDDAVLNSAVKEELMVTLNGAIIDFYTDNVMTDTAGYLIHNVLIDAEQAEPMIVGKGQGVILAAFMPSGSFGGTLSIPGDIIELLDARGGIITVECASAVHQLPVSMLDLAAIKRELNVSSSSDIIVDLAVSRANSVYTNDLETAAKENGFSVVIDPTEFTIRYRSEEMTRAVTKFDQYVEKSFVIPANLSTSGTTIVRVETSGAVNHVPSFMGTRANGDAYLTARTRQNGVYAVTTANRTYSDTPAWAVPAISSLGSRQILGDFSGRQLKPSQAATRAEVAGIVTKGMGIYTDKTGASKFLDVTLTDSYYIATAVAVDYDLINGYGDNTFKPEQCITRQEAAAILARTLRLAKNQSPSASTTLTLTKAEDLIGKFSDANSVADWAKIDVAECIKAGIIRGDNNNKINPESNVTRAEIVQMVYNLLTQYGYIGK